MSEWVGEWGVSSVIPSSGLVVLVGIIGDIVVTGSMREIVSIQIIERVN